MRKKHWIILICALLLIIAAGVVYFLTRPVQFNWSMTAYWITSDGTVLESFPITVQGKIVDGWDYGEGANVSSKNTSDTAYLNLGFPEDFPYSSFTAVDGDIATWGNGEYDATVRVYGDGCDEDGNQVSIDYFIDTEQGYFLMSFHDGSNMLLVGATDPDLDPWEVTVYLASFCSKE